MNVMTNFARRRLEKKARNGREGWKANPLNMSRVDYMESRKKLGPRGNCRTDIKIKRR